MCLEVMVTLPVDLFAQGSLPQVIRQEAWQRIFPPHGKVLLPAEISRVRNCAYNNSEGQITYMHFSSSFLLIPANKLLFWDASLPSVLKALFGCAGPIPLSHTNDHFKMEKRPFSQHRNQTGP